MVILPVRCSNDPPAQDPLAAALLACNPGGQAVCPSASPTWWIPAPLPTAGPARSGDPGSRRGASGSVGHDAERRRLWFEQRETPARRMRSDQRVSARRAIGQIAAAMRALRVAVHGRPRRSPVRLATRGRRGPPADGFYMGAVARGPPVLVDDHGQPRVRSDKTPFSCFVDGPHERNFAAFLSALKPAAALLRQRRADFPGLARFVVIATTREYVRSQLAGSHSADADARARYTIIARHHPSRVRRPALQRSSRS